MERVVVLGGGESGVGAALLAKAKSFDVFVSDGSKIAEKYKQELLDHQIDFEEEGHSIENIKNADVLIKSPGIPDHIPLIKTLIDFGLDPISEIEFAYRFCDSKIIAITGSNGKTTTTALIYHLLNGSQLKAKIGGNYGVSFARLLLEEDVPDVFVLEISSFQLDGIRTFKPDISVLLNITPDHLDRYHYNLDEYAQSKFRICMNQRIPDLFKVNQDQEICFQMTVELIKDRQDTIPVIKQVSQDRAIHIIDDYTSTQFYEIENTALQSVHNKFNAQCAILAAEYIGVDKAYISERLETFNNLPHRMEVVRVKDGVQFINDSKATNVDAVYHALSSLSHPVVWIAGGTDKGNEYEALYPLVNNKVTTLICLGMDNKKLIESFEGKIPNIQETKDINQAVQEAFRLAEGQGSVILSPACASFDLFKNYMDRGDQFRAAVLSL